MPKLSELGLDNKKLSDAAVDFDNLPKQGGSAPPPDPGTYTFQLPKLAALVDAFDIIESSDHGKRLKVTFRDAAALTIVASKDNAFNGTSFGTTLTSVPRNRARKGAPEVLVSDLNYLLKALGETKAPQTNAEAGKMLEKHAGGKFKADLEWRWSCNDQQPIWVADETGQIVEVPEQMGCGARYYMKDVARGEDGKYPLRITCSNENCGANIRAFADLRNFQAAGTSE